MRAGDVALCHSWANPFTRSGIVAGGIVECLHAAMVSLDDPARCCSVICAEGADAVIEFAQDFGEGRGIARARQGVVDEAECVRGVGHSSVNGCLRLGWNGRIGPGAGWCAGACAAGGGPGCEPAGARNGPASLASQAKGVRGVARQGAFAGDGS